jgi:hypothetical protein
MNPEHPVCSLVTYLTEFIIPLTIQLIQGIDKRMVRFQKLIKNLFLTLRGHNIHRQRRQLSKFLIRYQQFASCLLRGHGASFKDGAITADMLHRVWDEFDYRVDVCRVTQGAHIEGL